MADMFPPPQTPCWGLKNARMQTLQPLKNITKQNRIELASNTDKSIIIFMLWLTTNKWQILQFHTILHE